MAVTLANTDAEGIACAGYPSPSGCIKLPGVWWLAKTGHKRCDAAIYPSPSHSIGSAARVGGGSQHASLAIHNDGTDGAGKARPIGPI